jgi:hypothetical protein
LLHGPLTLSAFIWLSVTSLLSNVSFKNTLLPAIRERRDKLRMESEDELFGNAVYFKLKQPFPIKCMWVGMYSCTVPLLLKLTIVNYVLTEHDWR